MPAQCKTSFKYTGALLFKFVNASHVEEPAVVNDELHESESDHEAPITQEAVVDIHVGATTPPTKKKRRRKKKHRTEKRRGGSDSSPSRPSTPKFANIVALALGNENGDQSF